MNPSAEIERRKKAGAKKEKRRQLLHVGLFS